MELEVLADISHDVSKHEVVQIIEVSREEEQIVEQEVQHEANLANGNIIPVNWSRQATLDMINLHQEHSQFFQSQEYKKKAVWEMISKRMKMKGYVFGWIQCENKWKSLTKAYRDVINHNVKNGHIVTRTCAFFKELSEVYHYIPESPTNQIQHAPIVQFRINKRGPEDFVQDESEILQKKKKFLNTSNDNSSQSNPELKDLSSILKAFNEERKKQDKYKLDRLEKMHREKMEMFSSFLKVFKDSVNNK